MHRELLNRVKRAQHDVKSNPRKRPPSRPVQAPQHKRTADDRYELDGFDQHGIPEPIGSRQKFMKVINQADCAHSNVNTADDRHRKRPLFAAHGNTSSTASLGSSSSACGGTVAPASINAFTVPT